MIFRTCKLYEKVKAVDEFGHFTESYKFISDIEIDIAINKFKTIENGILYHTLEVVGVSPYKDFKMGASYKIVQDGIDYVVDKFIISRFTTLTLKRVQ